VPCHPPAAAVPCHPPAAAVPCHPPAAAVPHHPAHTLAPAAVARWPPPPTAVAPPALAPNAVAPPAVALNAVACWPPAPPAVVPPAAGAPPAFLPVHGPVVEPRCMKIRDNGDDYLGLPELLPGWQENADLPENNGIPSLGFCFQDEINPITHKNKCNKAWHVLEYMGEVDHADWVEEVYQSEYMNKGLSAYRDSFKAGCCALAIWGYAMGFNQRQFTQEHSLNGWMDHIMHNCMYDDIHYWNANIHPILCYAWHYVLQPCGIDINAVLNVNFKNWRDNMMRSSLRSNGRSGLPIISNEWFLDQ
jgi:hypothetical protein